MKILPASVVARSLGHLLRNDSDSFPPRSFVGNQHMRTVQIHTRKQRIIIPPELAPLNNQIITLHRKTDPPMSPLRCPPKRKLRKQARTPKPNRQYAKQQRECGQRTENGAPDSSHGTKSTTPHRQRALLQKLTLVSSIADQCHPTQHHLPSAFIRGSKLFSVPPLCSLRLCVKSSASPKISTEKSPQRNPAFSPSFAAPPARYKPAPSMDHSPPPGL